MSKDVATFGSKKSPVVVRLDEYKGRRIVDIRKYFSDKKSKELRPTKKGISLAENNFREITELIGDKGGSILEWLSSGGDEIKKQVESDMLARSIAAEEAAREKRRYSSKVCKFRGSQIAEYHAEGGVDRITLNENHPFCGQITSLVEVIKNLPDSDGQILLCNFVSQLLISYYRSIARFDDENKYRTSDLSALIEYEWGIILNNYYKK